MIPMDVVRSAELGEPRCLWCARELPPLPVRTDLPNLARLCWWCYGISVTTEDGELMRPPTEPEETLLRSTLAAEVAHKRAQAN